MAHLFQCPSTPAPPARAAHSEPSCPAHLRPLHRRAAVGQEAAQVLASLFRNAQKRLFCFF
jgi:hypothetical protein